MDFEKQMGVPPESADSLLFWSRGDGASYAAMQQLQKYLVGRSTKLSSFSSCQNLISTPEIWHIRATAQNTLATNHFGDPNSPDPSSISRGAKAAHMKIPSDTKHCDFYPTAQTLDLCFKAQVLDAWR